MNVGKLIYLNFEKEYEDIIDQQKYIPNLRWLKTVSSTFQDLDFDGS